jgi:chloramphenicol O-acetyltransferase type A
VAIVYAIARTANEIPEFRFRIRPSGAIEHEVVHPSTTILKGDDLFTFCTILYSEIFSSFATRAAEQITYVKEHPTLEDAPGDDDLLFMTSIPWVSFTSFMHPLKLYPADSIPRFAWGRFFEEGTMLKMPLSVQGHHAVMDGVHAGKFYNKFQDYLNQPDDLLGEE